MELVPSCHYSDRVFQHYLRGSLPEPDARAVERHYLRCQACHDRLVLLEWFPDAKPVATFAAPVTTIRCSLPAEQEDAPILQRALLSARMGFQVLAGSDQMLGVAAVAAMAVLVLSASLSVLPGRQHIAPDTAPVFSGEALEGTGSIVAYPPPDPRLVVQPDKTGIADVKAPRLPPPQRNPFLYAKVFVPPEYTPPSVRFGASEPVLRPPAPELTFHVSAPHLPFQPPKLDPPRNSRIKSVLKILSWPFRSERRDNTPGRTIS